jgi:methyltransferase-like protein
VTSLSHVQVRLSDFDRYVLTLLDGTRDERALVHDVIGALESGAIAGMGPPQSRPAVAETVRAALEEYRLCALLLE